MAAKLIAEEGSLKGLVLSLEDGEQWVIGRDPDACQLLVEDAATSRKHLICKNTPEGIVVENLSETNPVEINQEKMSGPQLLHNGDALKIGSGLFRFYSDSEAHVNGLPTGDYQTDIKPELGIDLTKLPKNQELTPSKEEADKEEVNEEEANKEEANVEEEPKKEKKTRGRKKKKQEVQDEEIKEEDVVKEEEAKEPDEEAKEEVKEPEEKAEEPKEETKAPEQEEAEKTEEATATGKDATELEEPEKQESESEKDELEKSSSSDEQHPSLESEEHPPIGQHLEEDEQIPESEEEQKQKTDEEHTEEQGSSDMKSLEIEDTEEAKEAREAEEGEEGEETKEAPSEEEAEEKDQEATQETIQHANQEEDQEKEDSVFDEAKTAGFKDDLAQIDFDFIDTGRWFLKVISGPNTGAEFSMKPSSTYVIGTDPATCDIVFHDASVSRQHARLTIGEGEEVTIEDLKSRNGTAIDDERITGTKTIPSNTVVTLGTTSFVVLDREGKRDTVISPLLPSIVKVLQRQEERKKEEEAAAAAKKEEPVPEAVAEFITPVATELPKPKKNVTTHYTALILIAMVTGILVVAGIGTSTLFKSQEVVVPKVNIKEQLDQAFVNYPSVKYSFNKTNGRLLIVGHVATAVDRTQLLYNLQGLTFVKSLDANIIIDEYIWQEENQVLGKNPDWRGVTIHSPVPGHFVLTGYLKTRKQADQLSDYLSQNFPYLDLLEKKIIVEEDVLTQINVLLQDHGVRDIGIQMNNGEVTLSGGVPGDKVSELEKSIEEIKAIPGVRSVNDFVVELAPEQSVINLSSKYEVTGYSHQGDVSVSVVINGRILSRGDNLDGMTVTSIQPHAVFLEKNGTKYRIDYNQ